MLAALTLIVVAAPLAGVFTGLVSNGAMQRAVRTQHQQRHAVEAVVVRPVPRPPLGHDAPETPPLLDGAGRVVAAWTAPDGTAHRSKVTSDMRNPHVGDHLTVWTDARGRVVPRPLDGVTAGTHAALVGLGAAGAAAAIAECARRTALWRLMRARYARWDRAWQKAGPDWGKTGTGS